MNNTVEFLEAVKEGNAPRVSALINNNLELVRVTGDHDKTGLHIAAELGHIEIARMLVDAGADITAKTSWGASSLEWAAWMGSKRVAEFLLSRGAGPLTFIGAAALGNLEEVKAIVESGVDLNSQRGTDAPPTPDDHWPPDSAHILGDTLSEALFAAARNGHGPVVEYLLTRGANVDAKGVFGGTGLHWAAINGHADAVELLISRGADVTIKDARFDATAEGWAEEGGHTHIADLLRRSRRTRPDCKL